MEWTDEGIVLGVKRHGETSVILELMTHERGRHLGLVRGGSGTRLRGILQPGNSLRATWRARLDEHLGHYAVEGTNLRAAGFLSAAHAVFRTLAFAPGLAWILWVYRHIPGVAPVAEFVYRFVARHRNPLYRLTRLFWGRHLRRERVVMAETPGAFRPARSSAIWI